MAYRPFYQLVAEDTPATVATLATVRPQNRQSVATVATVAAPISKTDFSERSEKGAPGPLAIAKPNADAGITVEDQIAAFEERAAILEYDEGLPRDEAERLAREQTQYLLH